MVEIEKTLHKLHAAAREAGEVSEEGAGQGAAKQPAKGFSKVSSVAEGSPAARAVSIYYSKIAQVIL